MNEFTKAKFHSLTAEQQHKALAKLLNAHYREFLAKELLNPNLYETYASWAEQKTVIDWSCSQSIANGYHFHLNCAGIQRTDANCLIDHFDKEVAETPWPVSLYLDNLRSAHNVGSILRTVESLGLQRVFFSKDTPWIETAQVQKTSCNAYLFVDCQKAVDLKMLPKPLIALETAANAVPLYEFVFPNSFTLAIGNEEYGCSKETLMMADAVIKIPMRGRKNSLNVANAFAITAAEIYRQRTY